MEKAAIAKVIAINIIWLKCYDEFMFSAFINALDYLIYISLASLLKDIGKQNSPRCDAAERGVPSGALLFASRNFIKK